MKKVFIFLMLAALFAPLAMNAQRSIIKEKDVDLSTMPMISLSELDSKGGDRATNTLVNENFENVTMYDDQYSATDWFIYNAGSGNNWDLQQPGSSYTHSGSMCMVYAYNRYNAADCYLVSEPFSVSASMAELSVSLYERVRSSSYAETFEVFFVRANDVTDLASVVSANHYVAIASASYTNMSYAQVSGNTTITALAGQSVRVVVHCTSAANKYNLYIDDITVTEITNDSACGVADLPHFNGFENETQYGCWTYIGRDVSLSTSNARTDNYCLRLNGLDDDQAQYLISPEFDGQSAMTLSFYFRIANTNRDQFFKVGYTTSDLSNINWDGPEIAHNTTYQEYTEVFPRGTKHVIISVYGRSSTSSYPSYMLIDDINLKGGCITPRGLDANNIATTTADLSWGDYADNYNVRYRTVSIVSATQTGSVFTDGFENGISSWTIHNYGDNSSNTNWDVRSYSDLSAYDGNYFASSRSYDGETDYSVNNWLITPLRTLGNVVKFFMKEDHPSWLDHVTVGVSTDGLTFVPLLEPTVTSDNWEEITVDLRKYDGRSGYFAIVHEDEGKNYVGIDDFGIYNYEYTYEYGPWQYTAARSNSVTLTGLTAETTYEVQVQSGCETDPDSNWSPAIDFTTLSGCTAPIDLTATDVTPISANLSWSDYQDSYNVRYRGRLFFEDFEEGIPSDWATIDADEDGYNWYLQSRFGIDNTSCAASASFINNIGILYPDNWLISPQLDLGGFLEVWVKGQDKTDYAEYYTIYLSTTGNDISDFTTELTHGTTTNVFQKVTAALTAYEGQQGYIAIRHHNCNNQYWFCVDNFGIYKTEDWLTKDPNEATLFLHDLLPNTEYVWQVSGDSCDNWSAPAYFTTPNGYIKRINGYGNGSGNYYLIASPIGRVEPEDVIAMPVGNNITPEDVTDMVTGDYDLYYFDQAQELEWINYKGGGNVHNDPGFNLVTGKGYLYANKETVDLVFAGSAYTGSGNDTLTTTGAATGLEFPTWNLVGNPFAKTAYIDRDFYVMNENGNEIITPEHPENGIRAMEGCFVVAETNGEILTFSTTAPTTGGGSKVVLNLSQDHKVIDRAIARFGQGRLLPKFQLNPNHTKVSMAMDGKDYAVVSTEEQGEMPVRFRAEKNGNYTLSVNSEDVSFAYLHLIDNLTGADVDLLETPSYSFEAKTTDYSQRFKLVFATGNNENGTFAFFSNGSFVINNDGAATLQVIDVTGRILKSESINGCANVSVDAAPGVYMLRLINGDNVKVQKVVVK